MRRLSKFLEVFGYDVRQATDGAEALAAAESSQPDFLILDGSSGKPADLQLCGQIRAVWPDRYTYCLLLVERPEVADITAALELGCDDFLAAPIVFGELLARLRTGARVLEFERRLSEQAGLDADHRAWPTRPPWAPALAATASLAKGSAGWLALIDPDYFQRFTDRYGRRPAQDLLQQVADSGPGAVQRRFAGGIAGRRPARDPAARQRRRNGRGLGRTGAGGAGRERPLRCADQPLKLTASCGLTEIARRRGAGRDPGPRPAEPAARQELGPQLRGDQQRGRSRRRGVGRDRRRRQAVPHDAGPRRDAPLPGAAAPGRDARPGPRPAAARRTCQRPRSSMATAAWPAWSRSTSSPRPGCAIPRPRSAASNSSVRLVRQVMTTDVTKFDEGTPLATLMEFFTGENAPLAVVVRDKRPRGLVHCQGLAALNDRLTADHFVATRARTGASEDLLVPDLAIAE